MRYKRPLAQICTSLSRGHLRLMAPLLESNSCSEWSGGLLSLGQNNAICSVRSGTSCSSETVGWHRKTRGLAGISMQTPDEDCNETKSVRNQRSEVQNPSSAANLLGVHGQVLALVNINLLTWNNCHLWVCIISVNPADGLTNNPGAILHFTQMKKRTGWIIYPRLHSKLQNRDVSPDLSWLTSYKYTSFSEPGVRKT